MVVLLGFCGRSAGPFLSFQRVSHASVVLCAVGNSAGPFPFSISLTHLAVLLLQAGRQENANFYPLILGTWGLWICRSLYAFYMGHIKSPWATVMVLIMVYLFCNWGDSGCRNALPYHWSSEHSRTRFLRARKRGAFGASANEANANRQEGE